MLNNPGLNLNLTDAQQPASTTFLNNTGVPSYDEFSRENVAVKKPWFQIAHLLTDDESDDDDDDETTIINRKRNFKIIASPAVEKRPPLINIQSPKTPKTPQPTRFPHPKFQFQSVDQKSRHTDKTSKSTAASPDYVLCAHKETQTSFSVEPNRAPSPISALASKLETQIVIDDSLEDSPEKQTHKAENSIIVINDSLEEEKSRPQTSMTTTNLLLRLSSSSTSSLSSNEANDKVKKEAEDVTMRKNSKSKVSFLVPDPPPPPPVTSPKPRRNNTSRKSNAKKRVSVCGQTFTDVVLSIDDTILDEYENELDHKSGKIFTLHEESIEKDFGDRNRVPTLSSTKARIVEEDDTKKSDDEENGSDELEKCKNFGFLFDL